MDLFFKTSNSLDLITIEELLLRNYSNIEYILNLEFTEGLELIQKCSDKELDKMLWDRWLVDYRNMTEETFINFVDYKNKLLNTNVDKTSKEELLKMANEIDRKVASKKRGETHRY